MILTVLIAGALVGRMSAAPIVGLTWALPFVMTRNAYDLELIVSAVLAGTVIAAFGVLGRLLYDHVKPSRVTARA